MNRHREELMLRLQELSFTLMDLTLFLDMNPECGEAIDAYNYICEQYRPVKAEYEEQYGPLSHSGSCPVNYPWAWINEPWPWQKRCGGVI